MSNSDLDVLIVGGYSFSDRSGGGAETRDKIRLCYKNRPVTVDFIQLLNQSKGNLEETEKRYIESNKAKLINRPLNTIYLYDFLTKNGVNAEVVNYFLLEKTTFVQKMQNKPKILVISTTFIFDANEINEIARTAKEISPDTIVIAGGIKILKSFRKFTLYNQKYFDGFEVKPMINNNYFFEEKIDQYIDIFVIEECGEITLLNLVKNIKKGISFKNIPNIAFRENGDLKLTERISEPYTFENNLISWDKIPKDILGNEVPVRAGIGCPFKCAFCDFTGLHKVKIRSIESLIEELKIIQKHHEGTPVFFTDDNLFTTKKRTAELCEAIIKAGLKFRWRAFFRVDAISQENVGLLKKSGCTGCFLGVESGDEQILTAMKKHSTNFQILNAIKMLNNQGINTLSTVIIGFPGETKDSINRTIDLLNGYPDVDLPIHQYYPFVFIYSPLAPIASPENRKKYRITGFEENWVHLSMNSEEAKEEMIRFFNEVNVPTLIYPEFMYKGVEPSKLHELFKTRDDLVKNGINILNTTNVLQVYEKFSKILHQ